MDYRRTRLFHPVSIPFGCKMLFNEVKLKPGVTLDRSRWPSARCATSSRTPMAAEGRLHRRPGVQVRRLRFGRGSIGAATPAQDHIAIVTFWNSFEEHEKSHADTAFNEKFSALAKMCTESRELGYDMLWQGDPEPEDVAACAA